jgi:hypothetical protein
LGNEVSLGDELTSIKLSYNSLQDLIRNWRQNSLVVVNSERGEDFGKLVRDWTKEDTESNIDVLQVLGPSDDGNCPGSGSNVKDIWSLDPWDVKMSSLSNHISLDSTKSIEYYGSVPSVNCRNKRK